MSQLTVVVSQVYKGWSAKNIRLTLSQLKTTNEWSNSCVNSVVVHREQRKLRDDLDILNEFFRMVICIKMDEKINCLNCLNSHQWSYRVYLWKDGNYHRVQNLCLYCILKKTDWCTYYNVKTPMIKVFAHRIIKSNDLYNIYESSILGGDSNVSDRDIMNFVENCLITGLIKRC